MPVGDTQDVDSDRSLGSHVVAAIFDRAGDAEEAARELERGGWSREVISVEPEVPGEPIRNRSSEDTKAGAGAIRGAGIGAVIGGVLGLVAGLAGLALPGIGPEVGAGPLISTLAAAAAGGAMGGLAGSFAGLGQPTEHAQQFEAAERRGGTKLSVRTRGGDEPTRVTQLLQARGARAVNSYNTQL